ncbi:MAG: DNA mismatch repair endonuclease MutL [Gammaproteobacteria bacterium]|nr:DNA mismatch repair endonuclease MutL [Gammaproteobacteria bacterium]
MLSRINPLSTLLANQIAAGEVIERPGSVVKELLENSIDARASKIIIDIEKGGNRLIRIRDNGSGIHPDDLTLALESHATSKLHSEEDLAHIISLGFRGEALASISAVSRVDLISCCDDQHAWQIQAAGKVEKPQLSVASHPQGTTIEIRDLFFNTPVRRKFLKTEKTEFSHIENVVERIALSHFDIAIHFQHNDRTVFNLPEAHSLVEQQTRLTKVCGPAFVKQSLHFSTAAEGLSLTGWISNPDASRAYADLQYFFVNGRIVKDKVLNHAVRVAAQSFVPEGRHLGYVLYLQCDPGSVDVNVHPTKHEVRFHESRWVHDFVSQALKKELASVELDSHHAVITVDTTISPAINEKIPQKNISYTTNTAGLKTTAYQPAGSVSHSFKGINESRARYTVAEQQCPVPLTIGILGEALLPLRKQFFLAENDQGLVIVNQQLAQRYIFAEKLMLADKHKGLIAQPLLLPVTVKLSMKQLEKLEQSESRLKNLGIKYQQIGPGNISIRELPALLQQADIVSLFLQLADDDDIINTLASFASHSAQKNLDKNDMNTILRQLEVFIEQNKNIKDAWKRIILH